MIKVLHVIKSLGRGGAETLLVSTIRKHSEGFQFTVVYFLPWKNQLVKELQEAGAHVICLKASNNLGLIVRIPSLLKLLNIGKYDLIHTHLPWSGVVVRLLKRFIDIPLIYTEHNKLERYHVLTRIINNITLQYNDKVIAVSEEVSASIHKFKGPEFEVETVVNGVDENTFSTIGYSKCEARMKLGLMENQIIIANVCVFRIQKRLLVWLSIARNIVDEFPDVRFLLVGDGPLKDQVLSAIDKLGLKDYVILPGLQKDVRPFLAASDVYMISSEFEGLPVSMLEAMSMSLPVVSTNAGGIGQVVQHGLTGFLVPVDKPEELLSEMKKLINNQDQIRIMGEAARERIVTSYSIGKMVASLERIYTTRITPKL